MGTCSILFIASALEDAPEASARRRSTFPRRTWSKIGGWPQECRYLSKKWKVAVDKVTEYLSAWKEATVASPLISAGLCTADSCRINVANSALPRNVD